MDTPSLYADTMPNKQTHRLVSKALREVVAANLKALMKAYAEDDLGTPAKIAKKVGLGRNTVKRMADAAHGSTLDTIEAVAGAFPVHPWQMLVPGMKAAQMPVLAVPGKSERAFYERVEHLERQVADLKAPAIRPKSPKIKA